MLFSDWVTNFFFISLILLFRVALCSETPAGDKKDQNTDPKPKEAKKDIKIEEIIKELDENMADVRRNPEKYKEKLKLVREAMSKDPDHALEKAGVAHFFKPDFVSVPFGIGFMAVGLILACLGRRIFKMFLGISGFIVVGSAVLYLIIQFETLFKAQYSSWVFWVFGIIGGLLGSYLFNRAWKTAIYALSAYGGVMAGFWILGMLNGTSILHYIEPTVFLIICAVFCLLLARFIDELVVITASAMMGGFTVVFGFDMIKCVGFRVFVKNTIDNTPVNIVNHIVEHFHHEIRFCMIGVLFITVAGIYVQFRFQPRSYDRD